MNKVFIIAEAGVNHNGSIELAKKLIDVAVEAEVDAVKFQTFKTELCISKDAKKADYQVENTKIGKNCIINTKALIEHDCIVEDNCHISTASVINGGVIVKNDSFVGSNSTSKQSIEISGFIKAGSLAK